MTNVLISVKPEHADAIMSGSKGYEFRRSLFRSESVGHVFVYSTSPIQMIVGTFRVGRVVHDHPDNLWKMFHGSAGIDEMGFFKYFAGCSEGFAIEVRDPREFAAPVDPWELDPEFEPPQSFRYVDWALSEEGRMRMHPS